MQAYRRGLAPPFIEPWCVSFIPPNVLHPGKRLMMRGQTPRRAFGIRTVCRMDEHAQQKPIGSNPALPFAPVDLFFPIVAAFSACFGRYDGWGVQDADGWLRGAIQRLSRPFAQGIIDGDAWSITIPWGEIGPNSAHWRNIFWTHAPLTARAMGVPQGIDDHTAIAVGRTSAVGRRGDDEWRDGGPVRIGPIGRIPGWIGSTCTSWQTRLLLIRTAWSLS